MYSIVEEKLLDVINKNARIKIEYEDYTDKCDFINDLGYDSISILQLVIDIEKEFEIEIEDENLELNVIGNYGSLKKFILSKLQLTQS